MTSPTVASRGKLTGCLRRSPEWAKNFTFSKFHIDTWKVDQIVSIWDATFDMSYVEFRRRLRELQEQNLKEAGFDQVINIYDFKPQPSNGWVVPTDDDDWFHPDIRKVLFIQRHHLVYWNFCNFTEGKVDYQYSPKERVRFESNNYAIFVPGDDRLLRDHAATNAMLRSKVVTHIPLCLSVHNRSLGSLGLLHSHLDNLEEELPSLYEVYSRDPVVGNLPEYFLPYVDRMQRIYQEMNLK